MNDPREYLIQFLVAMERATGKTCRLSVVTTGRGRELALEVGEGDTMRAVWIDAGDLGKSVDVLATECVSLLATQKKTAAS